MNRLAIAACAIGLLAGVSACSDSGNASTQTTPTSVSIGSGLTGVELDAVLPNGHHVPCLYTYETDSTRGSDGAPSCDWAAESTKGPANAFTPGHDLSVQAYDITTAPGRKATCVLVRRDMGSGTVSTGQTCRFTNEPQR